MSVTIIVIYKNRSAKTGINVIGIHTTGCVSCNTQHTLLRILANLWENVFGGKSYRCLQILRKELTTEQNGSGPALSQSAQSSTLASGERTDLCGQGQATVSHNHQEYLLSGGQSIFLAVVKSTILKVIRIVSPPSHYLMPHSLQV